MALNSEVALPKNSILIKNLKKGDGELGQFECSGKVSNILDEMLPYKIQNMDSEPSRHSVISSGWKRDLSLIDFYKMAEGEEGRRCQKVRITPFKTGSNSSSSTSHLLLYDFLMIGLEYDIRVKWHKLTGGDILIHFGSISDAISFYRQYYRLISMEFVELSDSIDWVIPEIKENSGNKILRIKRAQRTVREAPVDEFNTKVAYFNKLKGFFSKNDVKKMELMQREGNYEFLFEQTKEITCGCISNVVMQTAVKDLDDEQLCRLIGCLGQDIAPLAATKHGAYAIQAIIGSAKSQIAQQLLSTNFRKYGEFLICHEIGNYAIQKVLTFDRDLVFELFMRHISETLVSPLGFKILRRCLAHFRSRLGEVAEAVQLAATAENEGNCQTLLGLVSRLLEESINT